MYKVLQKIKQFFSNVSEPLPSIFFLFVSTRAVFTLIGVLSRKMTEDWGIYHFSWVYSRYLWLDIWSQWDSGWYLNIAEKGYPSILPHGESVYAFFPFYPLVVRAVAFFLRNYYVSGLVVSNGLMIVSCWLLYQLARLDVDEETSLRGIKYLFLFPGTFVLSGIFSESLFLCLLLAAFLAARKGQWMWAGVMGALLCLTRSNGVIAFPLFILEYALSKKWKLSAMRKDVLWLGLIPLGGVLFGLFCHLKVGNFFACKYAVETGWARMWRNPFIESYNHFISNDPLRIFIMSYALALIFFLFFWGRKYLRLTYVLWGGILLLLPLSFSVDYGISGFPRYASILFPFYLLLARISSRSRSLDTLLTISLAIFQGFLMAFWAAGTKLIM